MDSVAPLLIIFLLLAVLLALSLAALALSRKVSTLLLLLFWRKCFRAENVKVDEVQCWQRESQLEAALASLRSRFENQKVVTSTEYQKLRVALSKVDEHHEQRATELVEIVEERVRKDVGIQSEFHEKSFTSFKEMVNASLAENRKDIEMLKKKCSIP